eukprot:9947594-Lingulodinium_polyedra.AAC.1
MELCPRKITATVGQIAPACLGLRCNAARLAILAAAHAESWPARPANTRRGFQNTWELTRTRLEYARANSLR